MKQLKASIIFTGLSLALATTVYAQTATPSGTIRDSVKDQVAKEIAQIKQNVSKKAFVGSITAKSDASVTITNLSQATRTATITTTTTIKLANSKDGTPADLKVGDYVIAMGDADASNQMTINRLLVIPAPVAEKRAVLTGTVTKVSSSALSLKTKTGETKDFKLSSASTKYTNKSVAADVKVDTKLIIVYSTATNVVLRVHILQ